MKIIEQFIQGKNSSCEDMIFVGSRFISVIDGATSKNGIKYGDLTGGQMAASIIYKTLSNQDETAIDIIDLLKKVNISFDIKYRENKVDNKQAESRMAASVVIYDRKYHEFIFVGDCVAMYKDGDKFILANNDKELDKVTANARALYNQCLIKSKEFTIEDLLKDDKGREFILPLLKKQSYMQNKEGEFGYGVIDGEKIPPEYIKRVKLDKDITEIIMASDGYPTLFETLEKSEAHLQHILTNDPLMINLYKSTKGLQPGQTSFDDRAYISFKLID